MSEPAHLRVYRFDPGAVFEGGLLGAIERMQLGHDGALLDALFLRRDPLSGVLHAVDLATGGGDATFVSLLDFRLDPGRRRSITERTLAEHPGGIPRSLMEAMGATLQAGAAIFAILYTGGDPTALETAVTRCGGRALADEPIDARSLAQVGPRLRAAVAAAPGT